MTDSELMQEALNQLELYETKPEFNSNINKTIYALRARLLQEQMPTKIMGPNLEGVLNAAGFYRKREWVELTNEEKDGKRVLENGLLFNSAEVQVWELAVDWAEAKLKEKNA
jgi:hypothetical protein